MCTQYTLESHGYLKTLENLPNCNFAHCRKGALLKWLFKKTTTTTTTGSFWEMPSKRPLAICIYDDHFREVHEDYCSLSTKNSPLYSPGVLRSPLFTPHTQTIQSAPKLESQFSYCPAWNTIKFHSYLHMLLVKGNLMSKHRNKVTPPSK